MKKFIKTNYLYILLGIVMVLSYASIGYSMKGQKFLITNSVASGVDSISELFGILFTQAFFTIFYAFAIFLPIASKKAPNNKEEYVKKLIKYRFGILIVLDLIFGESMILLDFFGMFVSIFIILPTIINAPTTGINREPVYDLPTEFFKSYGIDNLTKFKKELAFKYIDIMFANNEHDYAELEKLCSKGKYAIFKSALDSQKAKKSHRVIDNINIYDAKIYKYEIVNNKLLLHMNIYVNYIDYMKQDNRVVYGSERTPNNYVVDLVFEKSLTDERETLNYCEECGVKVKDKNQKYCDECGASLKREKVDWVLKENIVLSKI